MAISMNCTNLKCRKVQEPYINTQDKQVYCSECDEQILNVSHFTKQTMIQLKQTKAPGKSAFGVICAHCKNSNLPKISTANQLICAACQKPFTNIAKPTELLIRDTIKKGKQDI